MRDQENQVYQQDTQQKFDFRMMTLMTVTLQHQELILQINQSQRFKSIRIQNQNIKIQIVLFQSQWDTAGQERFRTITNAYYRGAHAYDITNEQSFVDIEKYWLPEIKDSAFQKVQFMILGNKLDLKENRQVSSQRAKVLVFNKEFADSNKAIFFETSAKTADSVQDAFTELINNLIEVNQGQNQMKESKLNQTHEKSNCC